MERYSQLSLFTSSEYGYTPHDPRPPVTVTWNPWCGCTKASPGCEHCYMYRRAEYAGWDPTVVRKTKAFNLPGRKLRSGQYKGHYKIPSGSMIYTCFSSDFFHADADDWRSDAWDMMRNRTDCTFFMITKRPERIAEHLPPDWGDGWNHVEIAVTCENQRAADHRLPVYLKLPIRHKSVMVEPMLSSIDFTDYFRDHPGSIGSISVGGESGPDARPCDFRWVTDLQQQCIRHGVGFYYHQTGARLIKDGKLYNIPRKLQHDQARKARLDCNRLK